MPSGTAEPRVLPDWASPKDLDVVRSLSEGGGQAGLRGCRSFSGSRLEIVGFGPYSKSWIWSITKPLICNNPVRILNYLILVFIIHLL